MKYCRFIYEGVARYGSLSVTDGEEQIVRIIADPLQPSSADFALRPAISLAQATLLAPVQPSKIVCVGRNYREHAAELGNEVPAEPLIFLKPPSSLLDPGGAIVRPRISARVDYEGELGVVIGKRCRNIQSDEDVRPYILGYTSVNDATARDLQQKDSQWTRGKGFDSFCPVGPIVTDEIDPWSGVS